MLLRVLTRSLALALMITGTTAMTGITGGAPAQAASGAHHASGNRGAESVVVVRTPNSSFSHGVRHWRATGRHSVLRSTSRGHGAGGSVLLSSQRSGAAGLRQAEASPGLAADVEAVHARVWVRASRGRPRVTLTVARVHRGKRHALQHVTRTVRATGWTELVLDENAGLPAGTRLSLVLTVGDLASRQQLAVDDVRLWGSPGATVSSGAGRTWSSGASGDGVADGQFAQWRGSPVSIAGTWNDDLQGQLNQWSVLPGAEYGAWTGDLDVAVGGIWKSNGDTWVAAAAGAYDDRWAQALRTLAANRAQATGTTYIRFAHEFNGEWEPWSVSASEVPAFKAAWHRFRVLQKQIIPWAQLVFCPSSSTSRSLGLDWRTAFPGAADVDVVAVDYYNQWPFVSTPTQFDHQLVATDGTGAPVGLEAHRRFAADQGLPFAVAEWSSNADMGDGTLFVKKFHDWLGDHAGSGAGRVVYEIQFNVGGWGSGQFQLYPSTSQPQAAATYAKLW